MKQKPTSVTAWVCIIDRGKGVCHTYIAHVGAINAEAFTGYWPDKFTSRHLLLRKLPLQSVSTIINQSNERGLNRKRVVEKSLIREMLI